MAYPCAIYGMSDTGGGNENIKTEVEESTVKEEPIAVYIKTEEKTIDNDSSNLHFFVAFTLPLLPSSILSPPPTLTSPPPPPFPIPSPLSSPFSHPLTPLFHIERKVESHGTWKEGREEGREGGRKG